MIQSPPPEAGPVRDGEALDWPALEAYLCAELGLEGEFSVLQFPGGSANLTYLVAFGSTLLVVRRPPFGKIAPGAHDMGREYRVLSRLWQGFEQSPRALLFCEDESVIGADFLVMEYLSGVVFRGVPDSMRHHADVARRAGMGLVDATVNLHLVDPGEVGLEGLGRADGFVERQLSGWRKRWQLVAPDEPMLTMTAVAERLGETIPEPQRVSVVHSDLKLDNCLFDPADPDRVKAVFDWDMATLGDPLVDLGTLLSYWPEDGPSGALGRDLWPELDGIGMAARAELVARYAERSGLDLTRLNWYVAFASWKTAVALQQLYSRYAGGESQDARMARFANSVKVAAEAATLLLDGADR